MAAADAPAVRLDDRSRIVSIGGDVTEILYALGVSRHVVAVDSTSLYPAQALKEKMNVGYMRALSTEGVLSTNPTLLLVSERAGPAEVVKTLKSSSVPYVEVPEVHSADGITAKIRFIARLLGVAERGEQIAGNVEAEFRTLTEEIARIRRPVRALFVLSVQNGRVLVGGRGTSADAILGLAGAENVADEVTGFRPLSDEAILGLAPQVIVGIRGTSAGGHDLSQVFSLKGVGATPAGKARRLVTMDGLYLLGFGPRTPAAARELMRALNPELASDAPQ
ncbi:MAG TPA: ABC transporter substrate-binding protein [Hyphomicrobiaceae bacterium]|nr:ABC transporter substrate-binding protein [Hyphomicrobiaceae bacterium]